MGAIGAQDLVGVDADGGSELAMVVVGIGGFGAYVAYQLRLGVHKFFAVFPRPSGAAWTGTP